MKKFNTIIIDDEVDNINILKIYLDKFCKDLNVTGEATNVLDGIQKCVALKPDILFLDVKLGQESAFSILDKLKEFNGETIFVSALDKYAIKAINYNAAGYILKPIESIHLQEAVEKARARLKSKKYLRELENKFAETKEYPSLIAIPSIDKIELIKNEDIVYCEADGRYTLFHLTNGDIKIASRNLGEYEKILNKKMFFRIHHSYIVNLNMIVNINKSDGNYCKLITDKALPIAKRRQDELHRYLNIK